MEFFAHMIVAYLKFNWIQALIIHTCWELFQAIIGDNKLDLETLIDVPLDTVFFMVGYFIVQILLK